MKLSGKTALVTGGSRGIGRGIALELAREGADITIADARLGADAEKTLVDILALGRKAVEVEADVSKSDQVAFMIDRAIDALGAVDILVNNAGVLSAAPVEELEEAEWDRIMAVNAKGPFLCSKAVIPHMKACGGGRIINVASIAGKNGFATLAHYCASKFAVVGFTNTLAKELARDGITVNAICPGIVRTWMWDYLSEEWRAPQEGIEDSWARHIDTIIPQGIAQTPQDMGQLAVFFATAPHVTGQAINVDGGVELH
ncbi:SDR family NAD(P)-dependent oxidoreductase [Maricaulis sp.]|uniref:SDR family NAD(P)-dependent oxidoreductase n=1 Tax=Maricaulis sp. TaxID=1486257 RepID=UPI0025C635F5|nr:SDR family NAD(P)-dependent oxidoreductase [Maricaulis sp.]